MLAAATLVLAGVARERGSARANAAVDVVLGLWDRLPTATSSHATDVLRNASASVRDPARVAAIAARVPSKAPAALLHRLAGAWALAGDHAQLVHYLGRALAAGLSPRTVRRDPELAAVRDAPEVAALLAAGGPPPIPVAIEPHLEPVRAAIARAVARARADDRLVELGAPGSLADVLAAEAAAGIQLPNQYRALLVIHDGLRIANETFFGIRDLRGDTALAARARTYFEMMTGLDLEGLDDCVPLANWTDSPNNWLFYDPIGRARQGEPGFVIMLTADAWAQRDLVDALDHAAG